MNIRVLLVSAPPRVHEMRERGREIREWRWGGREKGRGEEESQGEISEPSTCERVREKEGVRERERKRK